MGRRMRKKTKDRIAQFFLDYVKTRGECTARNFTGSDEAREYNLTTLQFANLFREYKSVEPYATLIDCDTRNRMGATIYRYKGE